jgi:hypothetical protein
MLNYLKILRSFLLFVLLISILPVLGQLSSNDTLTDLLPATLSGTITNGQSGSPISGAWIRIPGVSTSWNNQSVFNGQYTLLLETSGNHSVWISKPGFQTATFSNISLLPGNTTVLNASLFPEAYTPTNLIAQPNGPQTAIEIDWLPPTGNYEIIYDDGIQDDFMLSQYPITKYAVKFNPQAYPVIVKGGKINIGGSNSYPNGIIPTTTFQIQIMAPDGPGGMPGTCMGTYWIDPTQGSPSPEAGWLFFSGMEATFTSGCFYLVMIQESQVPFASGIAVDQSANQFRSYYRLQSSGSPWMPVDGNLMIRAEVWGQGGPLPPLEGTSTPSGTFNIPMSDTPNSPSAASRSNKPTDQINGYTVWRLHAGQEYVPSSWVYIGSPTQTAITDNSWGSSLPCGLYRWGVTANYPGPSGNYFSDTVFTNALERCWTTPVTVNLHSCCPGWESNRQIKIQHLDYDTAFFAITDSSGVAFFPEVWKGNVLLNYTVFCCSQYHQSFYLNGDTTIDIFLSYAPLDPTDFSVNDQSMMASWNPPYHENVRFFETWDGGFTPNMWTLEGGINWNISYTDGNPAPSVMFNWSPNVTNYEQTLTSMEFELANAPQTSMYYDIYLDNYGTTTVNSIAAEVWDGSGWTILSVFDNQGGNIPWTNIGDDISWLSGENVKIRFRAFGEDSYDINQWNIDNIKVVGEQIGTCVLYNNIYLDNALLGITFDTCYQLPVEQLVYGQLYEACVEAIFTGSSSQHVCDTFTCRYLTPPTNLVSNPMECGVFLIWDKPKKPGGITPPGLIGYEIFRNGSIIDTLTDPDNTEYYDMPLDPGIYQHGITALYDLGPYGFPGTFGSSAPCTREDSTEVICGFPVPFFEDWGSASYSYHDWSFAPVQGNWGFGFAENGTAPYADFSWDPIQIDYSFSLISPPLNAAVWTCANLWLDFDYQLMDHNATGTEILKVDLLYLNNWHNLDNYSNTGSTNWIHVHLPINEVAGHALQIRFTASGENSSNILHWAIDNIEVYGVCKPPLNPECQITGSVVSLSWQAPGCGNVIGYQVYRSDSLGNPPFSLINPCPVLMPAYLDSLPQGWSPTGLQYYFTALFNQPDTTLFLCESVSSDTLILGSVNIPLTDQKEVLVYPNPVQESMIIESGASHVNPLNLNIYGINGALVASFVLTEPKVVVNLKSKGIAPGLLIYRITGEKTMVSGKIVLQ